MLELTSLSYYKTWSCSRIPQFLFFSISLLSLLKSKTWLTNTKITDWKLVSGIYKSVDVAHLTPESGLKCKPQCPRQPFQGKQLSTGERDGAGTELVSLSWGESRWCWWGKYTFCFSWELSSKKPTFIGWILNITWLPDGGVLVWGTVWPRINLSG